jgi:hypothetical protein
MNNPASAKGAEVSVKYKPRICTDFADYTKSVAIRVNLRLKKTATPQQLRRILSIKKELRP